MCSRRQKGLLQTVFCLVTLACLGSGIFLYNHLQEKVKASEALALKNKQQQEVLSAQLQVVYEHRSRLERSLQKERGEHKKTKEDFLVYKLEAQEALNKEKQDSMNRYGALSSQHKILKNQHEDVKKQLLDLQLQHNGLKLEHRKALETHNQKYAQLQREKEIEVVSLQDTVYKLREESKLLRKAHQDAHVQLFNAQAQMEEFRQLKETLQKMPSFKEGVLARGGQLPLPALKDQPPALVHSLSPLTGEKTSIGNQGKLPLNLLEMGAVPGGSKTFTRTPVVQIQGEKNLQEGQAVHGNAGARSQGNGQFDQRAPPSDIKFPPPAGPQDRHVVRFTRMVNSVQNRNQVLKEIKSTSVEKEAVDQGFKVPSASEKAQASDKQPLMGSKQDPVVQSWQDLVNKVNAQMDEEEVPRYLQSLRLGARPEQVIPNSNQALTGQQRGGAVPLQAGWEVRKGGMDDELQMDAGMIEREDNSHPGKEVVIQEPMVPDDAADPAQDPNNQGEDEFEEAELERPDFEKAAHAEHVGQTNVPTKHVPKQELQKKSAGQTKTAGDLLDDYQEDQEQDLEDHGGEVDNDEDLDLVQDPKGRVDRGGKKDDYY